MKNIHINTNKQEKTEKMHKIGSNTETLRAGISGTRSSTIISSKSSLSYLMEHQLF